VVVGLPFFKSLWPKYIMIRSPLILVVMKLMYTYEHHFSCLYCQAINILSFCQHNGCAEWYRCL
jgi:hypothetical protein